MPSPAAVASGTSADSDPGPGSGSGSGPARAAAGAPGDLDSRWLYYHKPSIAGRGRGVGVREENNVGPIQVEFGGRTYLGLQEDAPSSRPEPVSSAPDYAIISWPENSQLDHFEFRRAQLLFFVAMAFNITYASLVLARSDILDSGVHEPTNPNGIPQPFDFAQDHKSDAQIAYVLVLVIGCLGAVSVFARSELGIRLFVLATVVNVMIGSLHTPNLAVATRFLLDAALIPLAWAVHRRVRYSFVRASVPTSSWY